jgi:signal transduction histidine kinase
VRSEKLAGIGRLAAGVAHEINNPLGVILGYARLLRKQAAPVLAGDLGIIEEEALRCKDIVEGLLDLSRPLPASRQTVDLRALTDDVVQRLRQADVLRDISVTVQGSGSVEGHAPKLRQVLANILRNAAEAAGKGGRVDVVLADEASGVAVTVRDTGAGFEPAVLSRIFEPFLTTKDRGTGLGLAISRSIARAHGGDLRVANAPEGGALVTLRLPSHFQELAA